jgi:hypothetical protein
MMKRSAVRSIRSSPHYRPNSRSISQRPGEFGFVTAKAQGTDSKKPRPA